MNCPRIDGPQSAHETSAHVSTVKRPGPHWATTHLYFNGADLDASMKRFCLSLIVLLVIVGSQALA